MVSLSAILLRSGNVCFFVLLIACHLLLLRQFAQFERELMLERQREGVAKAKAEGKYKGWAPTARAKAPEIRGLHAQGVGPTEIAKRLGISRASVYRALP
jgi:DNA invertase Pin-like site-specific DNA recombinase